MDAADTPASMAAAQPTIVATGLAFGEGPRWHEGTLWWSDMHAGTVNRLHDGHASQVCAVAGRPSGLGWLPDGRLLIVSMQDKRVLRQDADGTLAVHADLSALAPRRCNDMVVDVAGGAYVGNFGFELYGGESPAPTVLIYVAPDGTPRVVAEDLMFPNGMAITLDNRTLIVAETFANRLTAFAIGADGTLTGRRVWAALPGEAVPDGICLDAEGAVWAASPTTNECLRLREGGEVAERIDTGRGAFACMLGGAARRTLFVCTSAAHDPERTVRERSGRIEAYEVGVAGVGLP